MSEEDVPNPGDLVAWLEDSYESFMSELVDEVASLSRRLEAGEHRWKELGMTWRGAVDSIRDIGVMVGGAAMLHEQIELAKAFKAKEEKEET